MKKTVIVTGGSRGIGAATCRLLVQQGYQLCFSYRQRHVEAQSLLKQLSATAANVIAVQADLTQESDVLKLFDQAESQLGPITHLVNNAGMLLPQSGINDISAERFMQMISNNLLSCFLACREASRRMQDGGAIVNVSSVAAKTGSPFEYLDYAASKAGIDTLTKGLAIELSSRAIRVNAVRPGFIHTDMHKDGGEPDRVQRLSPQIPLRRGGQPDEVAQSIAWLLSEQAGYITGSLLDVAGGR
ncbi:SDR family oxidoreductase [Rheinheimera faecalis]|uniref:SDR family oxidoreductase n=1 Tax=Rheinheimera faecalis TaxID=2901141 RepID=UPI001E5F7E0A|nr:SDR family oxidoreductase [Rheinheimera faecalis]